MTQKSFRTAQIIFALAGIFFLSKAVAQDEQQAGNRFLFIFSTSADMKNRVKNEQAEVNQILASELTGELQIGDTIGVWTFDQQLHTGQFPLAIWNPDDAAAIAKALDKFLGKQKYSKTADFNALQPLLNQVIQSSSRLTIVIFCDGDGQISGTPYNNSLNQIFQERLPEMQKSREPFILVLRTQSGKYVGCTIDFPPGAVNVPPFPPFPKPAPPQPVPVIIHNIPPPAPPPVPLIIIGTRVETNLSALQSIGTEISPATNVPAPQTNINVQTNAIFVPATNFVGTNIVVKDSGSNNNKGLIALAAGFLIAAIGLIAVFVFRARRKGDSSLITRSMMEKK